MSHHPIIIGTLLGIAAALCVACAIGLAIMRDAYQRMHFSSPLTSVVIALIVIAIWVEDSDWQSRIKAVLIALVLFLMNSILTHATARAIRIRDRGHWPVDREEHMPLVENRGEVPGNPAPEGEQP